MITRRPIASLGCVTVFALCAVGSGGCNLTPPTPNARPAALPTPTPAPSSPLPGGRNMRVIPINAQGRPYLPPNLHP